MVQDGNENWKPLTGQRPDMFHMEGSAFGLRHKDLTPTSNLSLDKHMKNLHYRRIAPPWLRANKLPYLCDYVSLHVCVCGWFLVFVSLCCLSLCVLCASV